MYGIFYIDLCQVCTTMRKEENISRVTSISNTYVYVSSTNKKEKVK